MGSVYLLPGNPPYRWKSSSIGSKRGTRRFPATISARFDNSQGPEQQLNLSVLRFTLGIPGLDESYLPRWIGYGFGSLLLLNHFLGSDSSLITLAQLRTEVLGLSLASFSIMLPYIGKFLKGAKPVEQTALPEGSQQIFVMSESISDALREDMAWASYILLRNTNAVAVLISVRRDLCVRGYWNISEDSPKADILGWFEKQVENIGLSDLVDTLYFTQGADSEFRELVPQGTRSLLVQPMVCISKEGAAGLGNSEGLILLASTMSYAFSNKDRAWIEATSNKFRA